MLDSTSDNEKHKEQESIGSISADSEDVFIVIFITWCIWQKTNNINDFIRFFETLINCGWIDSTEFVTTNNILTAAAFSLLTCNSKIIFQYLKGNASKKEDVCSALMFYEFQKDCLIEEFSNDLKKTFQEIFPVSVFEKIQIVIDKVASNASDTLQNFIDDIIFGFDNLSSEILEEKAEINLELKPIIHSHKKNDILFDIGNIQKKILSCKEFEMIFKNSEQAFYEIILGIKQIREVSLNTLIAVGIGSLTHEMLNISSDGISKVPTYDVFEKIIDDRFQTIFTRFTSIYQLSGNRIPYCLKLIFNACKSKARQIAQILSSEAKFKYCMTEYTLPDNACVNCCDTLIPVKGRIDAIFGDQDFIKNKNSQITIVDFKTGKDDKFSAKDLTNGVGVQIALYAMAMLEQGYDNIKILIIKPDSDAHKLNFVDISEVLANSEFLNMMCEIYHTGIVHIKNINQFVLDNINQHLPIASSVIL